MEIVNNAGKGSSKGGYRDENGGSKGNSREGKGGKGGYGEHRGSKGSYGGHDDGGGRSGGNVGGGNAWGGQSETFVATPVENSGGEAPTGFQPKPSGRGSGA